MRPLCVASFVLLLGAFVLLNTFIPYALVILALAGLLGFACGVFPPKEVKEGPAEPEECCLTYRPDCRPC